MSKKKILHVQVVPIMSGVQTVSYNILKSLPDDKYDKYILCGFDDRQSDDFFEAFQKIGVKVLIVPSLRREIGKLDFYAALEIKKILKDYSFDIVHTNSTKPGIIVRIIARLLGVPLILHTVHGIAFHERESFIKRSFYYLIETFSTLFGHVNICVNKCYLSFYNHLGSRNVCIYNGVDFNELGSPFKRKDEENTNVLFMGRLDEQKDPLTLLRAANVIINERNVRDVYFYIAGDGELRKECEEYIISHELCEFVHMLGWVNNKSEVFSKTDIFCLPSIYEAFGLVFVEAAHFSIPSISTNVEGIPEVVVNNVTGLLVEPKDAQAIADNIIKLHHNREMMHSMGCRAQERAYDMFSLEMMVLKYVDLYEKS